MAIPVYLQKYKAAGIYRIVFDKSMIQGVDSEVLRLVVGYSEKGPFNTPVYIKSVSEFISMFGRGSRKLEKRGVFFHRMAIQALATGPILALNLKVFESEVVGAIGLNPGDLCYQGTSDEAILEKLQQIIDEHDELKRTLETAESNLLAAQEAFSAAETAKNAADEAYAECKNDYEIKQAAIEHVDGLLTDYRTSLSELKALRAENPEAQVTVEHDTSEETVHVDQAISEIETKIQDAEVHKSQLKSSTEYITGLAAFNNTTTAAAAYTEAESALNGAETARTAAKEAFNAVQEKYESAKSVVSSYEADPNILHDAAGDFRNKPLYLSVKDIYDTSRFWKLDDKQLAEIYPVQLAENADYHKAKVENGEAILHHTPLTGYMRICATDAVSKSNTLVFRKTVDKTVLKAYDVTVRDWYATEPEGVPDYLLGYEDVKMNEFMVDVYVFQGKFTESITGESSLGKYIVSAPKAEEDYASKADEIHFKPYVENAFGDKLDTLDQLYFDERSNAIAKYTGFTLPYFKDKTGIFQSLDLLFNSDNDIHSMMMYFDALGLENGDITADNIMASANHPILDTDNNLYLNYATAYLEGYTYEHPLPGTLDETTKVFKPESTDFACKEWIKNYILDALIKYNGLRVGLCTKADIDYRYIIDTFKSYVEDSCKSILSGLAQEKQSAFAILNFPSVDTFKKHNGGKTFVDKKSRQFDVNKVVDPVNGFSLPSELEGASFCAFYTPLKFNDSGIPTIVPSAALVSNRFMEKYTSRQPYYVVAGQNYGLVYYSGLVGPDYNWSQDELQIIEPYGVNCMMFRPRIGTFINANQTAKQTPKSALSLVNVRELVIYLQDEIEKILQQYHWEINSASLRARILDRANYICEQVKNNNGLYDYVNIMDESNNTPDIIDNEMAVLSTHIEPGKGCGKMIQELTIYRTGGMRASLSE